VSRFGLHSQPQTRCADLCIFNSRTYFCSGDWAYAPLVGTLAAACRSLFVNLSNMWGVRRQRDHDNQERRCLGSIGTGAFAWTRDITINGSTTKGGWFSLRIHMN